MSTILFDPVEQVILIKLMTESDHPMNANESLSKGLRSKLLGESDFIHKT
jgi:hypothetical protein